MPRREALKWLTGAVAAQMLPASAAEASLSWKTAIGLNGFQSGTRKYQRNYPIWEVLDFAARNGFEGVELVADWPAGSYPAASEKARVQALRRLYDLYGLRIFSIHTSHNNSAAIALGSGHTAVCADRLSIRRWGR
jgi:hypothetical protein